MESKPLQRLVFGHRPRGIQRVLTDHSHDILRMKACLHEAGYQVSDEDLAAAWLSQSEGTVTRWPTLPASDHQLLATLLELKGPLLSIVSSHPPPRRVSLVDVDNGSGDQILPLPDDLVATLGWSTDDLLEMSRLPNGDVRLRKVADSP